MLKALELAGFKSFADKTRFDFPDGITVVVGPNGSGKSNIVDAIKWVLGTQSAKSLRGDDMADVIFKGSAAGGRKPSNSAEATLILDNSQRKLEVDSDEIHVTRRVYRSGESEYLINRQPCRLKDVKDLFRGSGVGVDAYSLIEQGKVDRMLQASPKDRRAIFEEAAGISRFKAKKVETERRLSRVDQNLVRLKDIVDEVHGRLTNLKSQATKAAQYREMTQRMSKLRYREGIAQHQALIAQSTKLQSDANALKESLPSLEDQARASKNDLEQQDRKIATAQKTLEQQQEAYQVQRERIASLESSRSSFQTRIVELTAEKGLAISRLESLEQRVDLTTEQIVERREEVKLLNATRLDQEQRVGELDHNRGVVDEQFHDYSSQADLLRTNLVHLSKNIQQHQSQIAIENGKLEQFEQSISEYQSQIDSIEISIEQQVELLEQSKAKLVGCQQLAVDAEESYVATQHELEFIQKQLAAVQEKSISDQGRLHGTHERLLLLQQLDEQQEGVGRGAKRLLELAKEQPHAPWNSVHGLVADLIEIDVHLAPLIDVALGQKAETVVLTDGTIVELVRDGAVQLGGRISMLRMDRLPSRRGGDRIQLDGLRGVLGRADRLVHTKPEYALLLQFLLGNTWLVDTLATAIDLSHLRGAGLSFVTAECEKIDADGTVSIGSLQTALGLVSRRSEMTSAREQIVELEQSIVENANSLAAVQLSIASQQAVLRQRNELTRDANQQLSNATAKIASETATMDLLLLQRVGLKESLTTTLEKKVLSQNAVAEATEFLNRCDKEVLELETRLLDIESVLKSLESQRSELQEVITNERIQLAKLDQRLEGLCATLDQLNRDASERQELVSQTVESIAITDARLIATIDQSAQADTELGSLVSQSKTTHQQLAADQAVLESFRVERMLCVKQLEQCQRQVDKSLERQESLSQEISRCGDAIDQLFAHYLKDYEIDISKADAVDSDDEPMDLESLDSELNQLRASIASVGAVNMEALAELDSLQARYDVLHEHYTDLVTSKENLRKIIERIDNDSKKLFTETLDAIRTNFQTLYRRSFGGGSADLVLEAGDDVMEAGVEIVATPPGKTALSNSLLSGGEKALTAVALIMAIFQFKPSPFCILDEVDAPFDEANIGRFVAVLTDFLHMTKFVVVSHSKKTMTAANTIYGVTMQESGVSRQVAVRFEEIENESFDDSNGDYQSRKAA
ncbi:MAG: chromosome segregation protein SMC [Planctomycetota bacterium]|nr:chromosome segregation protein SMC [Planctomycetota bacterium]